MNSNPSRRTALKTLIAGAGLLTTGKLTGLSTLVKKPVSKYPMLKGNINHSACYWVYHKDYTVEQFCAEGKKIGLKAIDLVGPGDWATVKKSGLDCGMANGAELGLYEGFNHKIYHETLIKNYTRLIPLLASYGFNNIICFSGARKGISDEEGLQVCAEGLKQLMPLAEKHQVTMTMELLNSKIDHHDYQCDHTAWGVELCKRVGSERLKLLYDIYHMQIMEGDLIRTLTDNAAYISHYHTGGVPGRHEIDESQEIYYPAVMKAIVKTGFKGSVAQEFVPSRTSAIDSLIECIRICDV